MCTVYGENNVISYSIKHRVQMLKEGRSQVEDKPHAGHPATCVDEETVPILHLLLEEGRQYKLTDIHHKIAAQHSYVMAGQTSLHSIITEQMEMCKMCAMLGTEAAYTQFQNKANGSSAQLFDPIKFCWEGRVY